VLLSGHREHFRWNLGHFPDSSRNDVSERRLGSSLAEIISVPRITYFWWVLAREVRNVRLAALNLKGDLRWIQGSQGQKL